MAVTPDPFSNATALIPRVRTKFLAGGAAGNFTLTGISLDDRLLAVWKVAGTSAQVTGTISQVTGTNTAIVTGFNAGAHTVTNGEDSAGTLSIASGLTAPDAIIVQVIRSGKHIATDDLAVSVSGANIVVADGSIEDVVEADVIHWIAYDASDRALTATFTGSTPTLTGSTPTQTFAATDLTAEFTITAANTINNSAGTASTAGLLMVLWYDHDYTDTTNASWQA